MKSTHPPTRRLRLAVAAIASGTIAAIAFIGVTSQSAQAIAAPADLKVAIISTQGVGLSWAKTGDDAYRVRFSTSSDMKSNVDTWDVLGNYLEWTHMDANPTATSARLKPGGTYYFQVKAITDEPAVGDRVNLSAYGKALKVTLPKTGQPELRPVHLKTTPAGADSMYVSWQNRGPGVRYVLRYTTDRSQNVLKWKSVQFDSSGGLVTGLEKNTKYYFRGRVIDKAGKALSDYSTSSNSYSGTTAATTDQQRIKLVSYNVHKVTGTPSWATRRKPVADNILAQAPDVVALQEATPEKYNGGTQYDDLVGLLGSKYELVTRTGSSGTKLVYNKDRLTVQSTGVKALTTLGSATRYAVWAILEDKKSGGQFFVIDTHLEPGSNSDATYNNARIKQAKEVLKLIDDNAEELPVVIAGDMNSSRVATPTNGQYETFTGAGYIDPIDNASSTWAAGHRATAQHILDGEYNSFNNYEAKARRTAYPLGTNADYVYTSPGITVATWRTVVNVGTDGKFVGTIPSDHNLIAMDLYMKKTVTSCE